MLLRQMDKVTELIGALGALDKSAQPSSASGAQTPSKSPLAALLNAAVQQGLPATPSQSAGHAGSSDANGAGGDGPSTAAKPVHKLEITKSPGEGDDRISMVTQGADIRGVLELLSEQGGLNILASKSVQGTVSASLKDVDVETALDAILKSTGFVWRREGKFLYVGTPQDFASMKQAHDRITTRLYRPNYIKASELETLITPLLTQGVGRISVSSPAEAGIQSDDSIAGGDGFAGQETILVRDYEQVLEQINQVVEQVDKRPTQVAIEAMIVSVKLDDELEFGVNFEVLRNRATIRIPSGSPMADLATLKVEDSGLKVAFLDASMSSLFEALETIGETNVIATPKLTCLNKHRAEILIGEELGYVSTTQTETSTTQSVEFLEVGTQLRLRPFISSDGLIRMEIHPELSTGVVNVTNGFTLPDKEVTKVTTNVMVRDGCTVIIGGLMQDELASQKTQIPLLGSLPWFGWMFRQNKETVERREILVLITPRIVYEPQTCCDGDDAANEAYHRHSVYADQMMPCGKQHLGRTYFHLAQDAWADGNQKLALRLVKLAVHFDPMSRAAIDLRADIVEGNPVGDHTGPLPWTPTVGSPLDGGNVAPWLLDRLEQSSTSPAVNHPLDAGRPGSWHELQPRPTP